MTTIYAVFLCTIMGGREICQPTSFQNDPKLTSATWKGL
jgi:hypothetical protein